MEKNKMNTFKDEMYHFFDAPIRENFSRLLFNGTGEQNTIDFKKEWIKEQKIAQIILGIANTDSGAVIFGVEENEDGTFIPCGLYELMDKADIHKKISKYLPDNLEFDIFDFDYSGEEYAKLKDKKFQVLIVHSEDEKLPYICTKTSEGLRECCIYTRRGTNTDLANPTDIEKMLSKRIRTMYSKKAQIELDEHLKQLKILYQNIDEFHTSISNAFPGIVKAFSLLGGVASVPNVNYPQENFEKFILKMILLKKKKIERILDLE